MSFEGSRRVHWIGALFFCHPPPIDMSVPLTVATIVVTGWNLVLTIALVVNERILLFSDEANSNMGRTLDRVRVEVGKPELDARRNAWRREAAGAQEDYLQSRVMETPKEVTLEVPYLEALVTVDGMDGDERRYCSICMN